MTINDILKEFEERFESRLKEFSGLKSDSFLKAIIGKEIAEKYKCECCDEEIEFVQYQFSRLCPFCDTGKCQNRETSHQMRKKIEEMESEIKK